MICAVLVLALLFAAPPTAVAAEFDPSAIISKIYDWLYPRKAIPPPLPVEEPPPIVVVPIEDIPIPVSPVVVAPVRAEPARPRPKPQPKPSRDNDCDLRTSRPTPSAIWCSFVCSHVRGKTCAQLKQEGRGRGTTQAEIEDGKACIKSYCPDAIKR